MTGGRLARVRRYVDDDHFCFTYGDGVTDLDIGAEIAFHRRRVRLRPSSRFARRAVRAIDGGSAEDRRLQRKPSDVTRLDQRRHFVLAPTVLDYIAGDERVGTRAGRQPRAKANSPHISIAASGNDGHVTRQRAARRTVVERPRALENLGLGRGRQYGVFYAE